MVGSEIANKNIMVFWKNWQYSWNLYSFIINGKIIIYNSFLCHLYLCIQNINGNCILKRVVVSALILNVNYTICLLKLLYTYLQEALKPYCNFLSFKSSDFIKSKTKLIGRKKN